MILLDRSLRALEDTDWSLADDPMKLPGIIGQFQLTTLSGLRALEMLLYLEGTAESIPIPPGELVRLGAGRGYIEDPAVWVPILEATVTTPAEYPPDKAAALITDIRKVYLPALWSLRTAIADSPDWDKEEDV